jgi:addiction module HigA family antidote
MNEERKMVHTATDGLPPIHPGEFLADELSALGLSARRFAKHIGVPANAITGILNGERGVSAQMALRLGKAFGTSEQYWLNLQDIYEVKRALEEIHDKLDAIEPLVAA